MSRTRKLSKKTKKQPEMIFNFMGIKVVFLLLDILFVKEMIDGEIKCKLLD